MTLSITGMSGTLALKLLDATETQQKKLIQDSPSTARAIANFKKEAGSITTAKDFVNNYDVYSFVMQAYDLKDQMFGKAMVQKILESDSSKSDALVNKMADARFTSLYKAMGFTANGTQNANTSSTDWQNQMVQKFIDQQYINEEGDQNATVKTALEFRQQASGVKTWYDILKNKDMGAFMRTVLNIPDGVVNLDIAKQAALFGKKYDITKLQDPAEVAKLVQKYVAMADAKNSAQSAANDPVVSLISGAVNAGSGQFVPATIDITSIDFSALSASKFYG